MKIDELENVLLDQIEKLNDDSIGGDADKVREMIERSNAIAGLANNVMQICNFKLQAVKEFGHNGDMYAGYLGLEEKAGKK